MNLSGLQVKNYGKFKDFECVFTPGLNVIKGSNEAGKSTLVKAITQLLYSDPQTLSKDEAVQIKSWGSAGSPILKATIESQDFSGLIEKDFNSGHTRLENNSLNVTIDDTDRITEILNAVIGFPSEELFEATSCVKQGEISHIEGSIKAIKDKLEALVTGGKEEQAASQIISKIESRIDTISRRDDNNPGLIQKLDKTRGEIDYNIEKLSRDINNIKICRNSLTQVEVAYINGVEDFEDKKRKLENATMALEANERLIQLKKEHKKTGESLEKIREASKKIGELSEQLKQSQNIPIKDKEEIDELESKLKYLKPKLQELEQDAESEQEAYQEFKIGGGPIGLTLISLLAAGYAAANYFMQFTEYTYEIGGGGIGLFLLSLFLIARRNARKAFLKDQFKKKVKKIAAAKEEMAQLSAKMKELFDIYHIHSAEEIHRASWKRNEIETQLNAEKKLYKQYLDGFSPEEIEIRLENIEKELADIDKVVKSDEMPDATEIERLKLIVSQLEEQKNNLGKELVALERQVDTAEGGSELLASYIERKEAAGSRMAELAEELAVLNLTKDCIEKARQNVMVSTLEMLEKRTSEILDLITNGKYEKVRLDKSSLNFEVFSSEKNDWVEPHLELSQATVEQIYLTARLALTEILGEKSKPPIILDDTFEHFDPQRHDGTMKLLKRMAEDRQILLLTSDDSYDRWADNTIQL